MKLIPILTLLLITIVIVNGCGQYSKQQIQSPEKTQQTTQQISQTEEKNTIEITSSGFNPKTLTITAGIEVTFVNKDSKPHWPASAVHPTHEVYPESGGCVSSKFDACRGLSQEESFSFVFNQKGTWRYHDHLNPSLRGTIIVE